MTLKYQKPEEPWHPDEAQFGQWLRRQARKNNYIGDFARLFYGKYKQYPVPDIKLRKTWFQDWHTGLTPEHKKMWWPAVRAYTISLSE